ncbi:MAG: 16S rRNA (cytosine(1402)-N(4))-methyltransferase RsmH [Rhizobiales bacterium]|nr:16S rRNA (cytosine(1402)-N(4))-methyltransferase RsmH [Hyphomicrobiales bacterium]
MTGGGEPQSAGAASGHTRHVPVLLREVLEALAPADGETYIDGTLGAGGYTRAILEAANCRVLAIDQDPDAVAEAAILVARFAPRLIVEQGNFRSLDLIAGAHGLGPGSLDGVVLDVGVSSMQLDDGRRGFSFMRDGPLDMRMSQAGESAAELVATAGEGAIATILRSFGEERRAGAIARAILRERQAAPISTTGELAALVERTIGRPPGDDKHPATRTFQALRLYVNHELDALAEALCAAERVLRPGGRLAVVSFHSLEDRIVKRFMRARAGRQARPSRHLPERSEQFDEPGFRIVNPRPLHPGNDEIRANPRARSASLRIAVRTAAPARAMSPQELGVPTVRR